MNDNPPSPWYTVGRYAVVLARPLLRAIPAALAVACIEWRCYPLAALSIALFLDLRKPKD